MSSNTKRLFSFGEETETNHPPKKHKPYPSAKTVNAKSKYVKLPVPKKDEQVITNKGKPNTFSRTENVPLAERMRPTSLQSFVGQANVIGTDSVLHNLLIKGEVPSMILWGPPGCGKTTLANIITHLCQETSLRIYAKSIHVIRLSAVTSGIGDVREAVKTAKNEIKFGRQTIVIMDEIHRFNKLQQDIFLPHVEAGTFVLIGATTENPSYSLNSALLSRCRVFVLNKLSRDDIMEILRNAVTFTNGNVHGVKEKPNECVKETVKGKYIIDTETIEWLAEVCDGDARVALGGLELAVQTRVSNTINCVYSASPVITLPDVKEGLKQVHMLFDRETNQSHHIYSALHKSITAGKANAALYWLARIMAVKEDPVNIARRFVRIASEDVGLADPDALDIAVHTMHGCQMIGMPECDVLLAQCVVYLCRAPKSRLIYDAFKAAEKLITEHVGPQPTVPLHIRDRSGEKKLQASLGAARKYLERKTDHSKSHLPAGLEHVDFFDEDGSP